MPKYCGRPEKEYLTQLGIAVECFQEKLILKETEFSHKGKKKEKYLRGGRNHLCKGILHGH